MVKHLREIGLLSRILIVSAFVLFSACSNDNPVVTNTPDQNALPGNSVISDIITELVQDSTQDIEALVSAPINAIDGGQIEINNGEKHHQFEVPPGALISSVQISVNIQKNLVKGKNALIFEFGPDGLNFRRPARLNVDMNDVDSSAVNANLYYFDPSANDWIWIEKVPVRNGKATFSIFHFSKYAIEN